MYITFSAFCCAALQTTAARGAGAAYCAFSRHLLKRDVDCAGRDGVEKEDTQVKSSTGCRSRGRHAPPRPSSRPSSLSSALCLSDMTSSRSSKPSSPGNVFSLTHSAENWRSLASVESCPITELKYLFGKSHHRHQNLFPAHHGMWLASAHDNGCDDAAASAPSSPDFSRINAATMR